MTGPEIRKRLVEDGTGEQALYVSVADLCEYLREPGKPWGPYPAAAAQIEREFGKRLTDRSPTTKNGGRSRA